MKPEHTAIMNIIEAYLLENPHMRFGQALFNLGINQFANPMNPILERHLLKDIYNDTDTQILSRIIFN
jgi:hypothetical protein